MTNLRESLKKKLLLITLSTLVSASSLAQTPIKPDGATPAEVRKMQKEHKDKRHCRAEGAKVPMKNPGELAKQDAACVKCLRSLGYMGDDAKEGCARG